MAATFFKKTKDRVTSKVEMCRDCIKNQIEEIKGNTEEFKRTMAILECHIEKGQGFALKADNGKYLTTAPKHIHPCEASNFEASKEEIDESCHFFLEKIDKNTIALKTASKIYVSRYTNVINGILSVKSLIVIDEQTGIKVKAVLEENVTLLVYLLSKSINEQGGIFVYYKKILQLGT